VAAPHRRISPATAPRLNVGGVNDPAERDADRLADAALERLTMSHAFAVSRSPAERATRVQRSAARPPVISSAGGELDPETSGRIQRARRGGSPLDASTRSTLGQALGADLSRIRVHDDSEAHGLSAELQATAFTIDSDIFLGSDTPDLRTPGGTHLLAHELAHTMQQGATRIQRKVGFEFEEQQWRPWRTQYRPGSGSAWGFVNPDYDVFPIARKQVVHVGSNFTAEADDTFGERAPTLEFVTAPFDETDKGLAALHTTLKAIIEIMARLAPHKDRQGPGNQVAAGPPPYTYVRGDYVESGAHKFSGSSSVRGRDVVLSGGHSKGQFKMQATMSGSLADISSTMEMFGAPGAGATTTGPQRAEASRLMRGTKDPGIQSVVLGRAPALAREVAQRVLTTARHDSAFAETYPGGSDFIGELDGGVPDLVGFLAAVMLYVKMLQLPVDKVLKYRIPFHARRSFVTMFSALSPAHQHALSSNNADLFVRHLLDVSNEQPLLTNITMDGTDYGDVDRNLTGASPLVRVPARVAPPLTLNDFTRFGSITIQRWMEGLTNRRDYLTPGDLKAALLTAGSSPGDAGRSAELLESFASLEGTPQAATTPPAVFENRGIDPLVFGNLNVDEVTKGAWNYLLYFVDWRKTGRPGTFPSKRLGEP
jgi:hypothetical protein